MKKKKKALPDRYCYPAVFTAIENGISITFPDLECTLDCKDEQSALRTAQTKMGRHLFEMEQTGEEIPAPTSIFDMRIKG